MFFCYNESYEFQNLKTIENTEIEVQRKKKMSVIEVRTKQDFIHFSQRVLDLLFEYWLELAPSDSSFNYENGILIFQLISNFVHLVGKLSHNKQQSLSFHIKKLRKHVIPFFPFDSPSPDEEKLISITKLNVLISNTMISISDGTEIDSLILDYISSAFSGKVSLIKHLMIAFQPDLKN